jgi:hypothetical protein
MAEGLPRSPRQVRAGVPAAIDAVACEALYQRPRRDRPALTTPALLAQALGEITPVSARPVAPPVDGFSAGHRLAGPEPADTFSWAPGGTSGGGRHHGAPPPVPGRRAVTTGAAVVIAIVVVLALIGVGGWVLSHHKSGGTAGRTRSNSPSASAAASALTPVSANATDDPGEARLAIDHSMTTYWHSSFYLGSPFFGHLTSGIGLVLNMGRPVKISQLQVLFGSIPGASVEIKMSNSPSPPSPAAAAALPTVARATDVSGAYTFTIKGSATGRDVVIWFTKLPPLSGTANRYQVNVYNVVVRGTG